MTMINKCEKPPKVINRNHEAWNRTAPLRNTTGGFWQRGVVPGARARNLQMFRATSEVIIILSAMSFYHTMERQGDPSCSNRVEWNEGSVSCLVVVWWHEAKGSTTTSLFPWLEGTVGDTPCRLSSKAIWSETFGWDVFAQQQDRGKGNNLIFSVRLVRYFKNLPLHSTKRFFNENWRQALEVSFFRIGSRAYCVSSTQTANPNFNCSIIRRVCKIRIYILHRSTHKSRQFKIPRQKMLAWEKFFVCALPQILV